MLTAAVVSIAALRKRAVCRVRWIMIGCDPDITGIIISYSEGPAHARHEGM